MRKKPKNFRKKLCFVLIPVFLVPIISILGYRLWIHHSVKKEENSYGKPPENIYQKFAQQKADGKAPAVLLIHGFGGSPFDFKPLTDELKKQGIAFHAILLPGHGTSPRFLKNTSQTQITDYSRNVLDNLKEKYGKVCVVGFSMGGTVALNLATQRDVDKLILFGPYIDITRKWYYFGRPEKWAKWLHPIVPYVTKIKIANINDPQGLKKYDSYKHLPVKTVLELEKMSQNVKINRNKIKCDILWFHSRGDIASDFKSAKNFFESLPTPSKKFVEYTRSNHLILYDYDSKDAIEKTVSFLKQKGNQNADQN